VTEAEYRDLSEGISRAIEIVHGHIIKCESPTPRHNRIARRLANALEASRSPSGSCLEVETGMDVVLWRGVIGSDCTATRPLASQHPRIRPLRPVSPYIIEQRR
jgi:hypothetical protein